MADIFISYARDDDEPPPDSADRKGFVTFLDESIRYEFRDLGPERPKIWRDVKRISDGDQFSNELEDALKNASFLLVVLSPNWMASNWCKRELDTFARYHDGGGLRERIIVVGKRHVDRDRRPSLLQGQTGFAFYARAEDPDEIEGDVEFFDRGKPCDDRYWTKLKSLAAYLLRRRPPPPPEPPYPPTGRTIYVAKPASDMRAGYDRIVSELTGKGHTVVPPSAEEIPLDRAVTVIDKALAKAEISVHLLGEKFGDTPEDQLPMAKLQLARAGLKEAGDLGKAFHRIVWAPSLWTTPPANSQPATEVSRHPIDVLARFDRQLPTDKIEGDTLSKLVDFVNQHLVAIAQAPPQPPPPNPDGNIRLYLYHSSEDSDYALGLARVLQQRNLEPLLPAFGGPSAEIERFNDAGLAECDAVVLCWAKAPEVWVRAQARRLRNWHDLGRAHQFAYRALVAAPPPDSRKKAGSVLFLRSEIDRILDLSDTDGLTADQLDPLVPPVVADAAPAAAEPAP